MRQLFPLKSTRAGDQRATNEAAFSCHEHRAPRACLGAATLSGAGEVAGCAKPAARGKR
jgi:hypothetical protein